MSKSEKLLYTIGHSNHSQEYFLEMLRSNEINCIVDVRSTPFSKYTPQFNKYELKKYLNKKGIYYLHMGIEFGARRDDKSLYTSSGYLDFKKVAKSKDFLKGIDRISLGVNKGLKISFMCTEKDPIDCHRNILVAKEFYNLGYNVKNILTDGSIKNQDSLENDLMDIYFEKRNQINIFDLKNESKTEKQILFDAYELRNKDIAYQL